MFSSSRVQFYLHQSIFVSNLFFELLFTNMNFRQAYSFVLALKIVIDTSDHVATSTSDQVTMHCFNEHLHDANLLLDEPLTAYQLGCTVLPILDFISETIDSRDYASVCRAFARVVGDLIREGFFDI